MSGLKNPKKLAVNPPPQLKSKRAVDSALKSKGHRAKPAHDMPVDKHLKGVDPMHEEAPLVYKLGGRIERSKK